MQVIIEIHNRIKGERAKNIEQAIDHYQQALEVRTRQAFPEQWAMTQNNLAIAYLNRIKGGRRENIEQAIPATGFTTGGKRCNRVWCWQMAR